MNPYLKNELKYFLHTFKRQPLLITKAAGPYIWDKNGRKYFDFFSGLAVCGVGHNHPRVKAAVHKQTERLLHVSNHFYTEPQMKVAQMLTGFYPGSRVFLANSGAEANELAIKLARLWATRNKKKGRSIITFKGAFHGRTLATVAASGKMWGDNIVFAPYPAGFKTKLPFNNLEAVRKGVDANTIAIMLEPIQGEGGIHIATRSFLRGIQEICRQKNLLLILDEVQSGMGRTGTFFAFEQYGIKPDIVTLAKGLAGGLPLSATLCVPRVANLVTPGLHGSTFGGNPLACAASMEVLKLLAPKNLARIRRSAAYLKKCVADFYRYPVVMSVRCQGLMVGIELSQPGAPYVDLARKKGLIVNCTQGNVIRLLPPYFMTQQEMNKCLTILSSVFDELAL
jgi:predicted acetylornithine/succinylornithine family transaminase